MFDANTHKDPSITSQVKTNNNDSSEDSSDTARMLVDPVESTKYERRMAREQEMKSKVDQKKLAINQISALIVTLLVNLALPLVLYYTLRNQIGAVYALLISGIPPLLNVIYKFIRNRKLDGFGILFVVAFVVSGVVSLITGDARVAVLRESIITGVIGVVFLFTMIPFRIGKFKNRPVLFLILREFYSEYPPTTWIDKDGTQQQEESVKWLFNHYKPFKKYIYVNTTFNGVVLLCECAVRLILVLATSLSIDDIVKYGTIMIAIASSLLGIVSAVHYSLISKGVANFYHDWMDENDFSYKFEPQPKDNITSSYFGQSKDVSIVKMNNINGMDKSKKKKENNGNRAGIITSALIAM